MEERKPLIISLKTTISDLQCAVTGNFLEVVWRADTKILYAKVCPFCPNEVVDEQFLYCKRFGVCQNITCEEFAKGTICTYKALFDFGFFPTCPYDNDNKS